MGCTNCYYLLGFIKYIGSDFGQRCQTLWAIQVNDIEISKEFMKVWTSKLLKQSKVNNHLREMYFEPFVKNSNICVIQCMKTYLAKTQELRKISSAENLFIITQKPYNSATKSTISRWIKLANIFFNTCSLYVCPFIAMKIIAKITI